jgi:hypothetical protein
MDHESTVPFCANLARQRGRGSQTAVIERQIAARATGTR